jgi:hypothetical protein
MGLWWLKCLIGRRLLVMRFLLGLVVWFWMVVLLVLVMVLVCI